VIVLVDIDSITRNDDMLKRQAELLEHTYEPIVIWALDSGVISYWNRAAEETYGYTQDHALGAVIHQLLATDVSPTVFRTALQAEGRWRGELRHRCRDLSQLDVDSRMALVRDTDGNEVVIETNRPLGERKRLEQQLRDRADALARADHAKNTFLAMLGHELRNPLAPLRNMAEILRQRDIKDPELVRMREMLVRQVQAMARMVDDLVDVARVTSHSLELRREPVELAGVVRNAVETVRGDIERRQQTLTVSLPPTPAWVDGDRVRLEQVVVNLLINASKFTQQQGRVALFVRVGEGRATINVEDNGMGIAPEVLPHVFGMFLQDSQAESRDQSGLGIGLTLVKQLVEMHGGSVSARSGGRGRGSEFTVSLPLVTPPASVATKPEPQPAAAHTRHRVLVVDDNEDAAASLSMLLHLDGHEVEQCSDGTQTLERLPVFKPDVVLLDIGLPGMDGYELAGHIRKAKDGNGVWLIALTGYGQEAHRRSAEQSGCDHFIVKPADYDTLRKLFDELPQRRPSS
jgi:PAS domain S-box-containing protein